MTRDELIAAMQATAARAPRKITLDVWGDVYVKDLTVEQADLAQQDPAVEGKDRLRFARGAARLLCDQGGTLIFSEENKEDLELLASQPWEMLRQVLTAGGDASATSEAGVEETKKA